MRYRLAAFAITVCGLAPSSGSAQSRINDLAGFYALIYTPAGALPSVVRVTMPDDSGSRGAVDLRYGRYKYRDGTLTFNNFGAAGQLRIFRRLSVGATVAYRGCSGGCEGLTMASVDAAATLLHHEATEPGAGDIEIGVQVSAGYGEPDTTHFTAQSLAVMLPLTVTLPQANNGLLTLSLVPGAAYGRLTNEHPILLGGAVGTFSSTRFLMGAGLGYLFSAGLGVHLGVHRIAIEESSTQSGLGVSWRF